MTKTTVAQRNVLRQMRDGMGSHFGLNAALHSVSYSARSRMLKRMEGLGLVAWGVNASGLGVWVLTDSGRAAAEAA